MEDIGVAGLILIFIIAIVSYQGLRDRSLFNKYSFDVDRILIDKEFSRLITAGFLHVNWTHLLLNLITLACFSYELETMLGISKFLAIYFGSLIGGNLFCLFIHRNHGDYTAAGASGAISGIIFACIAIFPGMEIGLLGLHIFFPAWLYGLVFVLYSIYGIRAQKDNIGHEAHLGGGLIGLAIVIAMLPQSLTENYLPIAAIVIPSAIFIYLMATKPEFFLVENLFGKPRGMRTMEDQYNLEMVDEEKELDDLLDKISTKGFNSLTAKEKAKLRELSERS
jgi:membrane associated rhomboid family serine protease